MQSYFSRHVNEPIWTMPSEKPENSAALVGATTGALVAAGCELVAARRYQGLETNSISGVPIDIILNSSLQPEDIRQISVMLGSSAARGYLGLLNESNLRPTTNKAFDAFLAETVTGKFGGASFNAWLMNQLEKESDR